MPRCHPDCLKCHGFNLVHEALADHSWPSRLIPFISHCCISIFSDLDHHAVSWTQLLSCYEKSWIVSYHNCWYSLRIKCTVKPVSSFNGPHQMGPLATDFEIFSPAIWLSRFVQQRTPPALCRANFCLQGIVVQCPFMPRRRFHLRAPSTAQGSFEAFGLDLRHHGNVAGAS